MSDIPSAANKVQIEATLDRKPVSQDLLQIMGGSINYLLDQFATFGFQYQLFTANGTWTAPANTTSVILFGCGGGGSGSAERYNASPTVNLKGGTAALAQWNIVPVTPSQVYTILIGSGGSPVTPSPFSFLNGNAGTSTFFKQASTVLKEYVGGYGGVTGTNELQSLRSANYNGGVDIASPLRVLGGDAGPFGAGGNAADFFSGGVGGSAAANTGAGGGAANSTATATSGAGGSGALYVIWF